jgi:hypothetical protein
VLASGQADDAMKPAGPLKMLRSINKPEFLAIQLTLQQDYQQACEGADAVVFNLGVASRTSWPKSAASTVFWRRRFR